VHHTWPVFFFLGVLGIGTRPLHMLGKYSTAELHP
jgi:hypothetical protein